MKLVLKKIIDILINKLGGIDTLSNDDTISDLMLFLEENETRLKTINSSEVSVEEALDFIELIKNQADENEKYKLECLSWLKSLMELVS